MLRVDMANEDKAWSHEQLFRLRNNLDSVSRWNRTNATAVRELSEAIQRHEPQTRAELQRLPPSAESERTLALYDRILARAQLIEHDPAALGRDPVMTNSLRNDLLQYITSLRDHSYRNELSRTTSYQQSEIARPLRSNVDRYASGLREFQSLGQDLMPALHSRRLALAESTHPHLGAASQMRNLPLNILRRISDRVYPLPALPWHEQQVAAAMTLHDRLGRDSTLNGLDPAVVQMIIRMLAPF
jgi:hypothetical protein